VREELMDLIRQIPDKDLELVYYFLLALAEEDPA